MNVAKHFLIIFLMLSVFSCSKNILEVDILIINGTVYNGQEQLPGSTIIAIKDDKIVFDFKE